MNWPVAEAVTTELAGDERRRGISGSGSGSLAACNQSVYGFEELPHIHNCVIPYTLLDHSWTPYHQTVYGYVHPVVVTATMVTNCLVCAVLLRPSMRSSTSTLLVAMAVSDTLTGLLPTPCFVVFYGFGLYEDWVPYNWCLPYLYLTDHLPTVFHMASLWLTVGLAAQRYVHVCHVGLGKRVCTVANMRRVIGLVYTLAFLAQLPRLLETRVQPVMVASLKNPDVEVEGCHIRYAPVVEQNMNLYFGVYFWARVVVANLVPCVVLVVLNAALGHTMNVARRRRSQLLTRRGGGGGGHDRECRRLGDSIATTLMLVAVVGVVLLVELPMSVFLIIVIFENTWHKPLMADGVASSATLCINLMIVLSYPVNFFIYCGMSRQFRTTFAAMLTCSGQSTPGTLLTTPRGTFNRGAGGAPADAQPGGDDGAGSTAGGRGVDGDCAAVAGPTEGTSPQPVTSSFLGRLRRSAAGAMSSPRVVVRLHNVSLLDHVSPTDEGQLDSGHL